MLNRIVHFSLKFRGVVVALASLLIGYGIFIAFHAKLDVFPNFVPPQVVIETEAPGLSPEQVEVLVTRPIETMVNGLGGLDSLRSESIPGLSVVTVVFKEGTDIFIARQMLAEKLGEVARELPTSVKTPTMSALTSATMDLLKIGLTSDKLSPMELRSFAEWTVRPRILSVPGVARCILFGGEVRQLQIQIQTDRLMQYGLSISDVLSAAKASTGVMGAGFVENSNQRVTIQTDGQLLTPELLGDVVVTWKEGQSVRLKDVAIVKDAPEPKFGDCIINGRPGVLFSTASQYGANTMEVTRALEAALQEMQPIFAREGVELSKPLHRPATFIDASIKNMQHSIYLGGFLVAVVLLIFLGHLRTALISLTAIPLSLLTAIIILDKFGVSLNTITLGGLAIAIGEVVDDAIIDVENIFRRLRENQNLPQPRSAFRVVLEASLEVRSAVVYATFIVALVFLPILTLTGLQGSFFAPLALSYILAIMASLGVALTLTPALSLIFFGKGVRASAEPRLQTWVKARYRASLRFFARWPAVTASVALLGCLATVLLLPNFGGEFLPEFREGHFVLGVQAAPGTSLKEMLRIGGLVTDTLKKNKYIATIEQQVGRAEQSEDTFGSHKCEFHVELVPNVPGEEQEKVSKEISDVLDGIAGIQSEVMTFLGDRISETITGETAPVVINVYGDDLDLIDEKAREIAEVINKIPGAQDVQVKSLPGAPRLAVRLRPERLTQFGFRPVEVLEAIQTAYQGATVAQIHEANRVFDVVVILSDYERRDPENIGSLMLKNAQGLTLPLRELAAIYLTTGRYSILHEGASRRQVVTCKPVGRDVTSFVASVKKEIAAKVNFPKSVFLLFGGTAQATEKAQQQLILNSVLAAAGILLLLIIVTGNWRNLALILSNVPFALAGGVLAVYLTSTTGGESGKGGLTIGSLVGFVTLFGITMRNSIMMISHFEHLVNVEQQTWNIETALRGASERFVPILMTALVTALGLLPLAIGSGEAGREIEGPMAIVILGGLVTSTILNLLFLPSLALSFGRFQRRPALEDA